MHQFLEEELRDLGYQLVTSESEHDYKLQVGLWEDRNQKVVFTFLVTTVERSPDGAASRLEGDLISQGFSRDACWCPGHRKGLLEILV